MPFRFNKKSRLLKIVMGAHPITRRILRNGFSENIKIFDILSTLGRIISSRNSLDTRPRNRE